MNHSYRFGAFELQPLQRTLLEEGQPLSLGARAFDVLLVLVERGGELVSKDELLQRAWQGLVVEEGNVHVQISLLRKLLGAMAIATAAGQGYRFALPVQRIGSAPHNLPTQRTSFIGRGAMLDEATRQLQSTRLLSFIGIGGSGKTRLALRLAERTLPLFEGGCWFVDLAPLEDPAQVPLALARSLAVAQGVAQPLEQALLERLRDAPALLLLDNCESVLDAAAALAAALLAGAPRLSIVCTSREALGLAGEVLFAVQPLELAAAGSVATDAESVRLFVDRADAAAPGLSWDATTVQEVAEICRRVDGIPLAIELAAARMKMLSAAQILALMNEQLRLLTGGTRARPRQQTLRTIFQWSYEHLGPSEQALLRSLSVCAGGCDLPAAVALMGGAADELAVLDSLTLLADKSLLTVQRSVRPHYLMLETVRQYALERLSQDGELVATRDRHRDHFVAQAQEMQRQLGLDTPGQWIARLDRDRDNLYRALAWCEGEGEANARAGLQLVFALRHYWSSTGQIVRGCVVSATALSHAQAQQRDLWRCQALAALAQQCQWLGRVAEAMAKAEESLAIASEIGDGERVIVSHRQLSQICRAGGDWAGARAHIDQSLALAQQAGDEREACNALSVLAELHLFRLDYEQAEPLYEEVLVLKQRLGLPLFSQAVSTMCLAEIAISRGAGERAAVRVVQGTDLALRTGSRYLGQSLIDLAAMLAALRGEAAACLRWQAASARQRQLIQMQAIAPGPNQAPNFERARQSLSAAAVTELEADARAQAYETTLAEVMAWVGGLVAQAAAQPG